MIFSDIEHVTKTPTFIISSVVELLASEGGAYITGQNIRVDGGITRSV